MSRWEWVWVLATFLTRSRCAGSSVSFLPGSSPYSLSSSMKQLCWCLSDCSPCKLYCWLKTERQHTTSYWHESPGCFHLRQREGIGLVTRGHWISHFLPGLWGLRELQLPLRMAFPSRALLSVLETLSPWVSLENTPQEIVLFPFWGWINGRLEFKWLSQGPRAAESLYNLNSALYLDFKFPWRMLWSTISVRRNLLLGALGTIRPVTCSLEGVLQQARYSSCDLAFEARSYLNPVVDGRWRLCSLPS